MAKNKLCQIFLATKKPANMPVYNKRGILLLPKVIVLNPKDGQVLCGLQGIFLLFNCQTPGQTHLRYTKTLS